MPADERLKDAPIRLSDIPAWEWERIIAQGRAALLYLALLSAA